MAEVTELVAVGTPFDRSKAICAPQAGQPYEATPRWRSGVRHLGHGIGLAVTQAANISWARRSDASRGWGTGEGAGRVGGVGPTTGDGAGAATRELPADVARRPQCGQYIPPVPVGSRTT